MFRTNVNFRNDTNVFNHEMSNMCSYNIQSYRLMVQRDESIYKNKSKREKKITELHFRVQIDVEDYTCTWLYRKKVFVTFAFMNATNISQSQSSICYSIDMTDNRRGS